MKSHITSYLLLDLIAVKHQVTTASTRCIEICLLGASSDCPAFLCNEILPQSQSPNSVTPFGRFIVFSFGVSGVLGTECPAMRGSAPHIQLAWRSDTLENGKRKRSAIVLID